MKWIKLDTSIFEDERVRLLAARENGDELICLWLRILCLAGRTECCGVLTVAGGMPCTAPMLAVLFGKNESVIADALETFAAFGMLELTDGMIILPDTEDAANNERLNHVREQNRERQLRFREKCRRDAETLRNGNEKRDVTPRNDERNAVIDAENNATDIDKDIDTDIDTDKDDDDDSRAVSASAIVRRVMPLTKSAERELKRFREQGIGEDLIAAACDICVDNASPRWSYLRSILHSCAESGIYDAAAFAARERDHRKKRASTAEKASAAAGYQSHAYTEADFGDDFYFDPTRDLMSPAGAPELSAS